jgi:hypothetical protein
VGAAITSYGTRYDGPDVEPVRVWGGRRLTVLARLLPLAERFDVLTARHRPAELLGRPHGEMR